MTWRGISLVFLVATLQVAGNLLLRVGVGRAGGLSLTISAFLPTFRQLLFQPVFDVGVLLYGLASIVWFAVVSTENLNTSYPLVVSMSFILVTAAATLLFTEPMSVQKVLGVIVLLAGILLVATSR